MSSNDYHLIPAYGKTYENEGQVKDDWNNGVTFRMLGERASYLDSRDYEKYCNPMDGVYYCYNGLYVQIKAGIV